MKKIWKNKTRLLGCLLALVMALSLAACGESPAPAPAESGEGTGSAGSETEVTAVSNETYRTVQIYQLDGEAEVVRDGKSMKPYINMMLENGDKVITKAASHLYARLDEDKYLLAEPESEFTLEATGTAQNSKTRILLVAGAVVSRITQPLSEGSTYEVSTPNSTMAVRGTGFRVAIVVNNDGTLSSTTQVTQGMVAIYTMDYGDVSVDFYMVEPNQKAEVKGDTQNSDIVGEGALELTAEEKKELEDKTIEFLNANPEVLQQTADENIAAAEAEAQQGENQEETTPPPAEPENQTNQQNTEQQNQNGGAEGFVIDGTGTGTVTGGGSGGSGSGGSSDSGGSGGSSDSGTTTPKSFTVKFMNGSSIFGTQTVQEGNKPEMPALQPTPNGEWCDANGKLFDFSQTITEDTVITWMPFSEG